MKKAFTVCLILLFLFTLVGCKSPSEMAAEKLTEKVLGEATGGKVNIDGDKITIETKDGSVSLGGTEWPQDKMGKNIPKLDGKVNYVANSDELCMIVVEEVKSADFEKYLEKVKDAGYNQDEVNFSDSSSVSYMATNADGIAFHITYLIESEEVSITVGKSQQ